MKKDLLLYSKAETFMTGNGLDKLEMELELIF